MFTVKLQTSKSEREPKEGNLFKGRSIEAPLTSMVLIKILKTKVSSNQRSQRPDLKKSFDKEIKLRIKISNLLVTFDVQYDSLT